MALPDINHLTELMNILKNQTPSSPNWYPIIDQVVGTLLVAEMDRAEQRVKDETRPEYNGGDTPPI